MKKGLLPRRCLIFLVGLFLNAVGVGFATKAGLGTSPMICIPYVVSLILPQLSYGTWTTLFCTLLIILQILMLRREVSWVDLGLQFLVGLGIGYFVDIAMMLLWWVNPQVYPMRILCTAVGCVIVAIGVYLELQADITMLSGDCFNRALAKLFHREFGKMRVWNDGGMAAIAALLSVIFFHKLTGVREGTLIAVLTVGNTIHFLSQRMAPVMDRLLPKEILIEDKC